MPRFFFHFTNGKRTFPDPIGVELNGVAAARASLVSQLGELKGALGEHQIQDWSEWTIVVEDEKKTRLLEMGFDLELRYSTKAASLPVLAQNSQRPRKTRDFRVTAIPLSA